jgi:hypothetical protein
MKLHRENKSFDKSSIFFHSEELKEYQINNFIQEQDKLKNNQDRN